MKLTNLRILSSFLLALVVLSFITNGITAAAIVFVGGGLAVHTLRRDIPRGYCYIYTGATLADIFIPKIYGAIQPNDSPEKTAFVQSGVAVSNAVLQMAANSGTQEIEVPLWADLDASVAPNLSDDTDTLATPGKVNTSSWKARNAYLNKGYGEADLVAELAKATPGQGDPMTRIRNRFGSYWAKQFQYRIIAIARGILNKNVATNSGDMVYDISLQTTVGQTAANKVSAAAVVGAVFTLGDAFEKVGVIAMHSVVYQNLILQELIEFVKDSTGTLSVPTYLGKRVVVDDGMPVIAGTTSGFRYVTALFGANAIGYGEGTPKVPAEIDRIPAGGNGGGLENIWERKTWLIHPQGWNFTSASVAARSATLAELRDATNWTRVVDRKNVPMAFLITNG